MSDKMSPIERIHRYRRRRAVSGGTARLRPPQAEAPAAEGRNGAGVLRPDTGALKLPPGYAASVSGESQRTTGRPSGVLLFIVSAALAFILIVTYFVSKMPAK